MNLEWEPRVWDGPLQYTDKKTKTLTMLPTDMALRTDPSSARSRRSTPTTNPHSSATSRRPSRGSSPGGAPRVPADGVLSTSRRGFSCPKKAAKLRAAAELRELAMHGSLEHMERLIRDVGGPNEVDVNSVDADSGRSALHKAAFWGHAHVVDFLTRVSFAWRAVAR